MFDSIIIIIIIIIIIMFDSIIRKWITATKRTSRSLPLVFPHGRQITSLEVCDLTSVTCDVTFFAKSLPVAVRVDKNVACLSSLISGTATVKPQGCDSRNLKRGPKRRKRWENVSVFLRVNLLGENVTTSRLRA